MRSALWRRHVWSSSARSGWRSHALHYLHMDTVAVSFPHPDKKNGRGEDGHFVSPTYVGVADGVGGWARRGVDAGLYSRLLMRSSMKYISDSNVRGDAQKERFEPTDVLRYAHEQTKVPGSSTACIIGIDDDKLVTSNLGDSGFVLLRQSSADAAFDDGSSNGGNDTARWHVVAASTPQLHYFNCPRQLSHGGVDKPWDAECITVSVRAGDLVITATDGLFDNLFVSDVVAIIDRIKQRTAIDDTYHSNDIARATFLEAISDGLAGAAQRKARSMTANTPFAQAAREEGGQYSGGKMDDITVLCSCIHA